ncbi:MAG: flavin reductase [Deltaproteobacteria bacterium]|nr:flavin reductase [Deltaproteobacteria bacterium]
MDKTWQDALGRMTYGIYVLTSAQGAQINGMIASWASQVSHEPPLIMVAIHPNRYSHALVEKSRAFALHVLDRNQKNLIRRFKGPDPQAKFESLSWVRGKTGSPILQECIACVECEVRAKYEPGNHSLFVGEVVQAHVFLQSDPLSTLDYEGVYQGRS